MGSSAGDEFVIFAPDSAVGMSVMIVKDLCSVAVSQGRDDRDPVGTVRVASIDGQPVRCFDGTRLSVDGSIADFEPAGVVFLAAFWGSSARAIAAHEAVVPWLAARREAGATLAAFSTGTFFLAETGLLDGRLATTYRPFAGTFRHRYPRVDLRPERALTDAGGLLCADGIPSSCDVIIALVEQRLGTRVAEQLARDFTMGFDRSYAIADLAFDGQRYHRDQGILAAQQWLHGHLAEAVRFGELARWAGMSTRTFHRRFKAATGESPGRYLQRLRVEAAKDLLADPSVNVSEIAERVGFADTGAFSAMFRRHTGHTPRAHRSARRPATRDCRAPRPGPPAT